MKQQYLHVNIHSQNNTKLKCSEKGFQQSRQNNGRMKHKPPFLLKFVVRFVRKLQQKSIRSFIWQINIRLLFPFWSKLLQTSAWPFHYVDMLANTEGTKCTVLNIPFSDCYEWISWVLEVYCVTTESTVWTHLCLQNSKRKSTRALSGT